ncbi:uncharacterized protein PGRI_005570 [Penicillium griseofulvum]|uniref:BTB domain-containing protein n=1 Tax=Penicillium patulum TaxID=5078 RepID=A0A135LX12_PENPA|nr:uncharacterized protein PGRI_005570 [Penicillium griseofulvum]KXG53507.1 hypothetical protein PGRI_005570 [Penicillium griseofulvum]
MDRAFGRSLSSSLVTFTVGADKKEIPVHSSALAQLSQSLDALINGEIIEAKTKQVDWSEVDVDTFARLCEFACRRNYISPSFRLIDLNSYPFSPVNGKSLHSNVGGDEATPEPTTFQYDGNSLPEMPYKERSISTRQLHNAFTQIPVNVFQSNPSSYSTSTSKTSTNTKPSQDFTLCFSDMPTSMCWPTNMA